MSVLNDSSAFDLSSWILLICVVVWFVIVFSMVISNIVKKASLEKKNKTSPILTVDAKVVAKRDSIKYFGNNVDEGAIYPTNTRLTYYITFEVPSGDRMELNVPQTEFGLLVEGDNGSLTFQGTRYVGFIRNRQVNI